MPQVMRVAGRRSQIRQGCLATYLTWSRSRLRRGSGNANVLLSIELARHCRWVFGATSGASGASDSSAGLGDAISRHCYEACQSSLECIFDALGINSGEFVLVRQRALRPECGLVTIG